LGHSQAYRSLFDGSGRHPITQQGQCLVEDRSQYGVLVRIRYVHRVVCAVAVMVVSVAMPVVVMIVGVVIVRIGGHR